MNQRLLLSVLAVRFCFQHVEREGRIAALGNNKSLLVYHFEQDQDVDNPSLDNPEKVAVGSRAFWGRFVLQKVYSKILAPRALCQEYLSRTPFLLVM